MRFSSMPISRSKTVVTKSGWEREAGMGHPSVTLPVFYCGSTWKAGTGRRPRLITVWELPDGYPVQSDSSVLNKACLPGPERMPLGATPTPGAAPA